MATDQTLPERSGLLADPTPLGFAGLALSAALFSTYYAGFMKTGEFNVVGMALFFGGLAQFLAGMWKFRGQDTYLATIFSTFGAFWMGYGVLALLNHGALVLGSDGTTWLWFCWAILTTYLWIPSFRANGAIWVVMFLWGATFWALWVGTLLSNGPGAGLTAVGGYLGWAAAAAAGYTSFAELVNSTFGRIVLPEFPTTRMRVAHR